MKKLTYSKGLVPLGFHGTDTCLVQVPGRNIELLLLIIAACDWARWPCTRKHRWKLNKKTFTFEEIWNELKVDFQIAKKCKNGKKLDDNMFALNV